MKLSFFSGNILSLIFTVVVFSSFAQQRLTLKDCLGYATANNHELKMAGYNVLIANKKVSEQTGNYLPQVNATGTFDDNLALSTQLMPAEMTGGTPGTYIAVKFGTKYSVSGGLSVTQKIDQLARRVLDERCPAGLAAKARLGALAANAPLGPAGLAPKLRLAPAGAPAVDFFA